MRGWVYFARSGSQGPIKIGHTRDVLSRLGGLSIGSPIEIVLLGALLSEQAARDEKLLQKKLAPHRIKGEWFQAEAVLHEMRALVVVEPGRIVRIESPRDTCKERLEVRTTLDEACAWQTAAEKDNVSLSAWIRRRCNAGAEEGLA